MAVSSCLIVVQVPIKGASKRNTKRTRNGSNVGPFPYATSRLPRGVVEQYALAASSCLVVVQVPVKGASKRETASMRIGLGRAVRRHAGARRRRGRALAAPRRGVLVAATEALTVGARARAAAATASPAVIVWTSAGELRVRVRADDDAAPLARRLGLRSMADALCCRRADGHRVACGAVVAGGMLVGALVVWARRAPIGAPGCARGRSRCC